MLFGLFLFVLFINLTNLDLILNKWKILSKTHCRYHQM